jgi:hypothetical protein
MFGVARYRLPTKDKISCGFAPEENTVDVREVGNRILLHLFISDVEMRMT